MIKRMGQPWKPLNDLVYCVEIMIKPGYMDYLYVTPLV